MKCVLVLPEDACWVEGGGRSMLKIELLLSIVFYFSLCLSSIPRILLIVP